MAKLKTTRFDAAEYLETPEQMAVFFDDALSSNDTATIAAALGVIARAKGMTALAKETGLSREHLYKALSAEGRPELDTVMRITRALGIELRAHAKAA
jgi:probable addiction module antidote protein